MARIEEDKIDKCISEFNQEGEIYNLIKLFNDCNSDCNELVNILNLRLNKSKTSLFKLQIIKIFKTFFVYIDLDGDIVFSDLSKISLIQIVKTIKNKLNNLEVASDFMTSLLALGKGELKSYDVFSNKDVSSLTKQEIKKAITDLSFWNQGRQEIHKKIISKYVDSIKMLSESIEQSATLDNVIYIMRGTVASGKTTFLSKFLKDNIEDHSNIEGIINTDRIKKYLIENTKDYIGLNMPGYLFHEEASMLSLIITRIANEKKYYYCLDKRMHDEKDLEMFLESLHPENNKVKIFDIRVDFVTSAMRVLNRTGFYPSDPVPDFDSLFNSFIKIEEGRIRFIKDALLNSSVVDVSFVYSNIDGGFKVVPIKNALALKELAEENYDKLNSRHFENIVLSDGTTLKEDLDIHAKSIYLDKFRKDEYYACFLENISLTSRSYQGDINVNASSDKRDKMVSGNSIQETQEIVKQNLSLAFDCVYQNKNISLNSKSILKNFITEVALIANNGLILKKEDLFRKGENSTKYNYIDTKNVEAFFDNFVDVLYDKLSDLSNNYIETAGWVEWNIDFVGHFFSDGCGRVAKLISSWILIRHNLKLPEYELGKDGYETVRESYRKRYAVREKIEYEVVTEDQYYRAFSRYYNRLFKYSGSTKKIVAAGGLVYNSNGEFLILQTSKGKDVGKWVIPGGKLELGENPIEAFKREIIEETGLILNDIALIGNRDYTASSGNQYHFYDYEAIAMDSNLVQLNSESISFKWIKYKDVGNFTFTDSIQNFLSKYFIEDMRGYYKKIESVDISSLDVPKNEDHTMYNSLKDYVDSKLPITDLNKYIDSVNLFEVHGIYPDSKIISKVKSDFKIIENISISLKKVDNSNSLRPAFYLAERDDTKFILCCVTPGEDLLIHYSSMIKYYIKDRDIKLSVFSYPMAESKIGKWTGLDEAMIYLNDTVILGYSTYFKKLFIEDVDFSIISTNQNKFYTSTRFLCKSGSIVNCLEANYGHWGNISDFLAQKICQLKAYEIIHIGKVGTLSSADEVYKRIYIPESFVIGRKDEIFFSSSSIRNSLEYIREYSSLSHASVSTTMEETFSQRDSLEKNNVETIDIESSKIAQAVALYNLNNNGNKVRFGAIHFSSDYLKKSDEFEDVAEFDLTTSRDILKHKKYEILDDIFHIVKKHL